jgi:hypothetical protein
VASKKEAAIAFRTFSKPSTHAPQDLSPEFFRLGKGIPGQEHKVVRFWPDAHTLPLGVFLTKTAKGCHAQ